MAIKDWTKQKNPNRGYVVDYLTWSIDNEVLEQYTKRDREAYKEKFFALTLVRTRGDYNNSDSKRSDYYRVYLTEGGGAFRYGKSFKTKSEAQKYMKEFMRKN